MCQSCCPNRLNGLWDLRHLSLDAVCVHPGCSHLVIDIVSEDTFIDVVQQQFQVVLSQLDKVPSLQQIHTRYKL